MAELKQGMPISESAVRPINELAHPALLALSGGEIPVAGQGFRAFGERLGETYRNPITAAIDIGSLGLTGVPWYTTAKGSLAAAQGLTDAYLSRKGFTALSAAEREALNKGINPFAQFPVAKTAGPVAPTEIPRLTYNPTPEPTVQPVAPETIYVDPQGGATTARALPYAPESYQGRLQAAETMGTPHRIAAAQEAERQALIDKRMAEVEANRQQMIADQEAAAAAKAAETEATKQRLAEMIRAKQGKPATEAPVAPVEPTPLPETPAPATTTLPSDELLAGIGDMAKKSHADIRFDIKNTATGAVNTKNKIVQLDKAPFDDLAGQYGAKINWDEMPELKNGASDAREQVRKFVWEQIKDTVGPEKRGPQMRTLQKQAEAELGITNDVELTPEMLKRIGASSTPTPAPAVNPALQAALDRMKAQGKYKPPGVSEMMIPEISDLPIFDSKQAFAEQQLMDKLAGKVTTGAYIENGKLYEHFYNASHRNAPESIKAKLGPEVKVIVTDLNSGKVIEGGSGFKQKVEDQLKKRK